MQPLSPNEEPLWVLAQADPAYRAYNTGFHVRISGDLDVRILEASLTEIVRRHDVLRTSYGISLSRRLLLGMAGKMASKATKAGTKPRREKLISRNRLLQNHRVLSVVAYVLRLVWAVVIRPYRTVHCPSPVCLNTVNLENVDSEKRECELSQLIRQDYQQPFTFSDGPCVRMKLFRIGPTEHVFAFTVHHLIADASSMVIFCRELRSCYGAYSVGRRPDLPEISAQYADYSVWRRARKREPEFRTKLQYWKKRLEGLPLTPPLTTTSVGRPGNRSERLTFTIGREETARLKTFSRDENITLFMVVLVIFQVLIHEIRDMDDIVIGVPRSERTREEFEGLMGLFVDGVIVRGDLSGNPTFRELVSRTRAMIWNDYAHADSVAVMEAVGFYELLRNRAPLFRHFFNWTTRLASAIQLPGLETKVVVVGEGAEAVGDLDLLGYEDSGVIQLQIIYKAGGLSPVTARKYAERFSYLESALVLEPDVSIQEVRTGRAASDRNIVLRKLPSFHALRNRAPDPHLLQPCEMHSGLHLKPDLFRLTYSAQSIKNTV